MFRLIALVAALPLGHASKGDDDCANAAWGQCGGSDYSGDTCCPAGYNCTYSNDFYSGCNLETLCLVVQYGQCGGTTDGGEPWPKDQSCCPGGFECSYVSSFYSQCVEKGSNNTDCSPAYGQCGGEGWDGPGCCVNGYECTPDPVNPVYYSGCTPVAVCSNAFYGQCGGVDSDGNPWTQDHDDCCPDGFECSYQGTFFSQCCPPGGCNTELPAPAASKTHHKGPGVLVKSALANGPAKNKPSALAKLAQLAKPKVGGGYCKTDKDCKTGGASDNTTFCVTQADGYYAECINCESKSFNSECAYWSTDILVAAEETCSSALGTDVKCPNKCPNGLDSECDGDKVCVMETENSDYNMCIDCTAESYQGNCFYWDDEFLKLANDKCGTTCESRCPNHVNSDCSTNGTICVVQTDGFFDQCVNCDPETFNSECVYWSEDMRQAAEVACQEDCR